MSEGELLTLFVPFGRIVSLRIMRNRWGRSRGLGFVEYDTLESAVAAKDKMHGHKLEDRSIIVDYAEPDPLNTPEGQARHEEKLARIQAKKHAPSGRMNLDQPFSSAPASKRTGERLRQSVYDQRQHHSQVGAKFAARNKKK